MHISALTLYTKQLDRQIDFYQNVLCLQLLSKSKNAAEFSLGATTLQFVQSETANPYHFAINIPSNKAREAVEWVRRRAEILKFESHELIDFSNWNAEAVYFYDPDGNIVELIARKNLAIESAKEFSTSQFLYISEIGTATTDISKIYTQLNSYKRLSIYDGNFDKFCAAGDEHGLFILVDLNKKVWFPTNDVIQAADYVLRGDYNISFKNGEVIPL